MLIQETLANTRSRDGGDEEEYNEEDFNAEQFLILGAEISFG